MAVQVLQENRDIHNSAAPLNIPRASPPVEARLEAGREGCRQAGSGLGTVAGAVAPRYPGPHWTAGAGAGAGARGGAVPPFQQLQTDVRTGSLQLLFQNIANTIN